jgi:hypothetical protein
MLTIDKNPLIINNMKWQLNQSFAMKDLALTKQILGNRIYEGKKKKRSCIYHKSFLLKKYFIDLI